MQIDLTGMTANGTPRKVRGADELLEQSWRRSLERALWAQQDRSGLHEQLGAPAGGAAAGGAESALRQKTMLAESGVDRRATDAVRGQMMVSTRGQSLDPEKVARDGARANGGADPEPDSRAAAEASSARQAIERLFATPQTHVGRADRSQTVASEEQAPGDRSAPPRASSSASKAHLFVEHTRDGLVLWVRDKHSASAALDVAVSALMQDARARGLRFSAIHLNGRPYEMDVRNDELPDPSGEAGHPSEQPTLAEGAARNLPVKEA